MLARRAARDFTMPTPCWRGENTVFHGVFAVPRIYGFLKDLAKVAAHCAERKLR
jgi:hypothetical protein